MTRKRGSMNSSRALQSPHVFSPEISSSVPGHAAFQPQRGSNPGYQAPSDVSEERMREMLKGASGPDSSIRRERVKRGGVVKIHVGSKKTSRPRELSASMPSGKERED